MRSFFFFYIHFFVVVAVLHLMLQNILVPHSIQKRASMFLALPRYAIIPPQQTDPLYAAAAATQVKK